MDTASGVSARSFPAQLLCAPIHPRLELCRVTALLGAGPPLGCHPLACPSGKISSASLSPCSRSPGQRLSPHREKQVLREHPEAPASLNYAQPFVRTTDRLAAASSPGLGPAWCCSSLVSSALSRVLCTCSQHPSKKPGTAGQPNKDECPLLTHMHFSSFSLLGVRGSECRHFEGSIAQWQKLWKGALAELPGAPVPNIGGKHQ